MFNNREVNHEGIVISGEGDYYSVRILSKSACAECHAKGICSVADVSEKIIECEKDSTKYQTGERVQVVMAEKFGWIAIFYAFIIPFIVMVSTLLILIASGLSERVSGLFAVLSLIPYYFMLHLFSEKITKDFKFKISKFS
jgi:sigma-E factor negative regulatory protein RseC